MESTNNSSPTNQESVDTEENSPSLPSEERTERVLENWSLRRSYEWVDLHVHDYFYQYQWLASLRYFVSNAHFYKPQFSEDVEPLIMFVMVEKIQLVIFSIFIHVSYGYAHAISFG